MLNISKSDVVAEPFPHVISEQVLEPSLYAALRKDYPTAAIFEGEKARSGMVGSRTGQGFDIYRGDSAYDALISGSEAWREFDAWINSRAFVEKFLDLFGDHLDTAGIVAEVDPDAYNRATVEGREGMTEHATFSDRVTDLKRKLLPTRSKKAVNLFTRLDVHKALTGYAKAVHCDRANRLCSFIVYFVDAEKIGLEGGDLTIHAHRQKKAPKDYERHPKPEDAPVIATLRPKENLGVLFPCSNNSYHGVTAVRSSGIERDYLYINISGDAKTLW